MRMKNTEIVDVFGPKRSTGPNVKFLVPKGRDPGRDPLVLWWGPGPLSFVVGPGTRAGTP